MDVDSSTEEADQKRSDWTISQMKAEIHQLEAAQRSLKDRSCPSATAAIASRITRVKAAVHAKLPDGQQLLSVTAALKKQSKNTETLQSDIADLEDRLSAATEKFLISQ